MERVSGDSGAIASSTNSFGTPLRRLTAKRASSSGKEALSRRGFDMGGWVARFYLRPGDGLAFAGQASPCHGIFHWPSLRLLGAKAKRDLPTLFRRFPGMPCMPLVTLIEGVRAVSNLTAGH